MIAAVAELSELPLTIRAFVKVYQWRRIDPIPWSPLRKPLSESKIALVSTAGAVAPGQEPFDLGMRGGDFSFRVLDRDTNVNALTECHRSGSFDRSGIAADMNLAVPLDRFRELEEERAIGSFNRRVLSFMGSITAPGRLIRETAPRAADLLVEDGVEGALLVPV